MLYAVLFVWLVVKYAGVVVGKFILFLRRGKEGREKLFCNLGFCVG